MNLADVSRRRSPVRHEPSLDWPPTPDALRPSPFPHPVLQALYSLSRMLLFPAYWSLDQLLGCWAPMARSSRLGWLKVLAGSAAALLLVVVVGLPLALFGLVLWLPLQVWRRPFCYQPPPACWVWPQPWHPPAERVRCFVFFTANLCLLPDGLARFSNLSHSQQRSEAIATALLGSLRMPHYGATECSQSLPGVPAGVLSATIPTGLDFVCLQEVFDLRAARRLVHILVSNLGPVLYDVGTFGLVPGPYIKVLGSGLLLASRYPLLRATFRCFPNARGEDALASKGLLSAQAQLGILDGRRIVGYLHCTHLQAPVGDGHVRCKQLTLLLEWVEEFEAESRQSDEAVAFSVLLGDLNFDNSSLDHTKEQGHKLFSCFQDPCRLGTCQEQPWALGTILSTSTLHHAIACSPEMLRRALEQEKGRRLYLAGPLSGSHYSKSWQGRRLDYIMYRGIPDSHLRPEVEQVTFSTALAGLTDHLAVGLNLQVSCY
ncbi:sphingomyelin phosphodiesterase 5 [Cricetulus griseus]|uniref:sphingomyelin phosphodiesterase n=1 Tax=Cricetulus griseus TaxID=10029 RepID=G3HWI8_CRIGR|nr:sphingomyelin phosphodiesterase 5 [Cricetulus griseus]XP_027260064.1 sphingomyelin phosphodiesterase 5 [Cricetulus griseus]EGV92724.1 Sphingomyelin phosphodiesterase 3 [Cricetulus griseus]ERE81355.1 sphingomyelin phosphodiesterase 3-like protein [Cricetulus griseus]